MTETKLVPPKPCDETCNPLRDELALLAAKFLAVMLLLGPVLLAAAGETSVSIRVPAVLHPAIGEEITLPAVQMPALSQQSSSPQGLERTGSTPASR